MSGSTIGSFVGAGIGFLIGGPAGARIGWMAGGLIGGLIAPEKIKGPRLTDARSQTAQDGTPRTYGNGTFPTTGVLLWRDPTINEVETEEGGKGGPKQVSYTYTRSYAIGVCRGPIAGYLIIKRNGKIVYDTRTNAELIALGYTSAQIAETRAAQAKWLEVATLYYGGDDQLPDPTIQAVKGAGNVPAYRGSAYIVCTDDDVTELQGAVPQYEFVVSVCGTRTEEAAPEDERFMAFGVAGAGFRAASRPLDYAASWVGASDADVYATNETSAFGFAVFDGKAFAVMKAGGSAVADLTALDTWAAGPTGLASTSAAGGLAIAGGRLWRADGTAGLKYLDTAADAAFQSVATFGGREMRCVVGVGGGVLAVGATGKVFAAPTGTTFSEVNDRYLPAGMEYLSDCLASNGTRVILTGFRYAPTVEYTDNLGTSISVSTFPATGNPSPRCARFCGGTRWLVGCSASAASTGLFMSTDNAATFAPVTLPHVINISEGGIAIDGISGRCVVFGTEVGTSTKRGYWTDDYAAWNEISFTGTAADDLVFPLYAAGVYVAPTGTELPDAPGHYVDDDGVVNGPNGTTVDRCLVTLGDIVEEQCAVRGVTSVDVSELTDEVDGFRVASETSPQRNIQALQVGYFFDGSEYDGVLHFPKRGASATFALTEEDFVSRDGDPIEWEVTKENELLRKVTVGYIDPATTYTQTTQNWERRAGTIAAQGEGTIDLSVTGNKDWAKQAAEKHVKAAWAETKECKFSVSVAHASLVTGQVGTIPSSEGGTHLIRITRIEDDGDVRHITAKKTQPNAYESTATGVVINPPRFPGGQLSGPTVSAVMNLPVLRDVDDKPGLYWAATGLLTSWPGALLTLSRNGTTFENGPQITVACTMGVLTAPLPAASRYALDTTNTLSVRLYPGASDLANVSFGDMIESEANPFAILYPDGTAEILQFTTRTLTGTREYDLAGLLRGRMDTTIDTHAEGALFVLLDDNVRFAAIRASDVGKTLTTRAVSLGTVADSNPSQTITMTTIESQREWQPYNVTVTKDADCQHRVEFIGRHRLGTDSHPIASQWFTGWRIDFTVDGVTKSRVTQEQSFLYTTAMQVEDWGAVRCAAYEVSVTAVNAYAGGDGAGGAGSGGLPTVFDLSEPFAVSGTLPDGYVGVPYVLRNGDMGLVATGGFWDGTAYGEIAPGVGAFGDAPLGPTYLSNGIPHAAGTYAASLEFTATSPVAGHAGSGTIANSVTIAAKPSYSTIDMRLRINQRDKLVDTTPPWTTFELTGGQLYSYGFDSGKCRGEFTLTGNTGVVTIGVNVDMGELTATSQRPGIAVGFPNRDGVEVLGDGTFAVEYDCATGAWEVFEAGVGSIGSGTLALPSGNLARIIYGASRATPVVVKANFGNEAWVISPSSGFGGVPMPSVVIPVSWDDRATPYSIMRAGDGFVGNAAATRIRSPGHTFGTLGKSSGKWRVGILANKRIGLAVAAYDSTAGNLGDAGTANSVGYDVPTGTLHWCFGGAHQSVSAPVPVANYPHVVFALDMTNSEVTFCYQDFDGSVHPIYTITGVPAGTWFPCESNSFSLHYLTFNPNGPIGFSDWAVTV